MKKHKYIVEPEYRLYTLVHRFLSPLQKGLQSGHVGVELVIQGSTIAQHWALYDKTMIDLDGGNSKSLFAFEDLLKKYATGKYPWIRWKEDADTFEGVTTAIGVVLPRSVYAGTSKNKSDKAIYSYIKDLPLAV